ncbi:MAG: hypothetical protein KY464_17080, partial [Gemmatimonadetes bacterium]|nr:hypothetical protein [Gemmatimonadota bacterium]
MVIRVRQGRGRKDRLVMLSPVLVEELREGGYVIVVRHTVTEEGGVDDPTKLDVCEPQRELTDEGRQQARELGAAIADLDIPIGQQWLAEEPVRIGAGSWIGAAVIVLPGSDIGRHVTVAAGSVVRGSLPDNCVAAGSPAKVVRQHVEGRGWVPEGKPPPAP